MASGNADAVIGLDLGTTDIKAIAFGADGTVVARASRPAGLARGADGSATLDPDAVAEGAEAALAESVAEAAKHGYRAIRVGISAAMHSVIPVGADGRALTSAMTWADLRPQPDALALWRSPDGPAVYGRTGTPVHASSPLAKLLWLRRVHPDIAQRAVMFAGLKEWLWRRWFGEWAVDASLASATGLYNLASGQWDASALALAGVTAERLPRLTPTTYARADLPPESASRLGLREGVVIATGGSDGALANLGVGALNGSRIALTIGTSLAARRGSAQPRTDPTTRAFCYAVGPDLFIRGAASNNGGGALEWLFANLLAREAPTSQQTDLTGALDAASQARAEGVIFLPYIAGERAPLWSSATSGALVGLKPEHTAADALRAGVEGLLFNARWLVEQTAADGAPPESVVATGGVFQSEWIAELAATVLNLPVIAAGAVDASARGAALLADIAAGVHNWASAEEAGAAELTAAPRYTPATDGVVARSNAAYQRFRTLVAALEPAET